MSTFKQFLSKDIKVVPFTVNKEFTLTNSEFYTSSADAGTYKEYVGVDRFLGKNLSGTVFETTTEPTTGTIDTRYQRTIYNSVKELYYSNFLTSSWGDPSSADTQRNITGSFYTPNYYNYLSSTLTASRYFPTASNSLISVTSIPSKLFGEYIQPKSFEFKYTSGSVDLVVYDDGEGNLYASSSFTWYDEDIATSTLNSVGINSFFTDDTITFSSSQTIPSGYNLVQISPIGGLAQSPFYSASADWVDTVTEQALLDVLTISSTQLISSNTSILSFKSGSSGLPGDHDASSGLNFTFESRSISDGGTVSANEKIGNIIYEHGMVVFTNQSLPMSLLTTDTPVTCSFKSSTTIYETQYKCTARESEFNFSLNPSLIQNNTTGSVYDFTTGSFFAPYVTTVGLYDNNQNLLAVGKLSQPIQSSRTTDTTILVNIDL